MLTILTYHSLDTSGSVASVAPQTFADHMACLRDMGVRGIALREAVEYRDATGSWPPNAVVLTFDDGYANFYDVAWPTLMRHGYRATVLLVTEHVGRCNDWMPLPRGLGSRRMLSWQQAAELNGGGIEIGTHTRTHADLRGRPTAEAEQEIAGSRQEIENRLNVRAESFAYPFGRVSRVAEAVVRREFRAACTTVLKRADEEPLHRLPRVDAYYIRSLGQLRRLLMGQWDRYLTVRRTGRWLRRMGKE